MFDHETYAKAYINDARQATEAMANELVKLADDLKTYASAFPDTLNADTRNTPSSFAAAVVAKFNSSIGTVGSRAWDIIHTAGRAEYHMAKIENEKQEN